MTDITDATVAVLNHHIPLNGDAQALESLYTQLQERQANHHGLIQEVLDRTVHPHTPFCTPNPSSLIIAFPLSSMR